MITLIGHGYIGDNIAKKLINDNIKFHWIHHGDEVSTDTTSIINAAGYTGYPNVDACEYNKQDTIQGNVVFPLSLEQKYKDIPIVHISSGCVYTGYKSGGWLETDPSNFSFQTGSFYSGSKDLAHTLLEPYLKTKSYVLRLRMPFGDNDHSKNFLSKMKNYKKLVSYDNSMSYINDIVDVSVFFAIRLPSPGIYNLCNPGYSNAREIVDMMGLDKEWFTDEEFMNAVITPRSNCILNVDKLMSVYPMRPLKEVLLQAIRKMKEEE
jgi:UDP-glucose 4,6-dehydratase